VHGQRALLELTVRVDTSGAHPYAVGPLPEPLVGLQESLMRSQQWPSAPR
jgi:alpha-galactosidase/6-phospho-beta-glucosidase family protein